MKILSRLTEGIENTDIKEMIAEQLEEASSYVTDVENMLDNVLAMSHRLINIKSAISNSDMKSLSELMKDFRHEHESLVKDVDNLSCFATCCKDIIDAVGKLK